MAMIMGASYPDLFCAVGVHSGLPYQAAQNLWTALRAMARGVGEDSLKHLKSVRTIVFHGSTDTTVHPRNAEQIIEQLLGYSSADASGGTTFTLQSGAINGRSFDRKIFRNTAGCTLAEQWLVRGTSHAWSGGSAEGSHSEPAGPDASREMLRFFLREAEASSDSQEIPTHMRDMATC
jgi:poly(3-hydroxybutyrate) depolymerase